MLRMFDIMTSCDTMDVFSKRNLNSGLRRNVFFALISFCLLWK